MKFGAEEVQGRETKDQDDGEANDELEEITIEGVNHVLIDPYSIKL